MPHSRTACLRPIVTISVAVLVCASMVTSVAAIHPATPGPDEEILPVSQAIVDNVAFALMEWGTDDSGYFVVSIDVRNDGDLPVRFEPALIVLTVDESGTARSSRALLRSDPSLPCSLFPGAGMSLRLSFDLEASARARDLTIEIVETNRTGAKVIFPLQPGAGATAIGGSGLPGTAAGSTPASGAPGSVTPDGLPASPEASGCQN